MTTTEPFELLTRLTDLLLRWSYEGTAGAERIVRRVAGHYAERVDVSFLPETAILTVGDRTVARSATPAVPPLHQVSALKRLLNTLDDEQLSAGEATRRLARVDRMPDLYRPRWRLLGLVLFSVGFGISVQSTWQEVVASAVLGLCVGILVLATDNRPRFTLVAPFVASILVSVLVLIAFGHGWIDGGPIQLIVPALFYFIPGDALASAMLELAAGRITAGASRLVYSLAVLVMLGFGAFIATVLVHLDPNSLFDVNVPGNLGPLLVWSGWVIFAVGVLLTFSMAPADFPWALGLVLLTAGVLELASAAFGEPAATFVGAAVMTVVAFMLGRLRTLPPPFVLYLGAFYVLTPGSHGLRGIESWIGGNEVQGVTSFADMIGLLAAIGLGMLVGATIAQPHRLTSVG